MSEREDIEAWLFERAESATEYRYWCQFYDGLTDMFSPIYKETDPEDWYAYVIGAPIIVEAPLAWYPTAQPPGTIIRGAEARWCT